VAMELTPDEKQRIYLEEKARLEGRKRAEAELATRQKNAEQEAKRVRSHRRTRNWGIAGIVLIILSIWGAIHSTSQSTNKLASVPTVSAPPKDSPKEDTLKYRVQYVGSSWRKEGFDNVLVLNFFLTNNSNFDVKDIELTCSVYGGSGTTIGRTTKTVYAMVKANSSQEFLNFNMDLIHSQTQGISCQITDLVLL
jgi:hypothetical protein